MNPRLIVRLSLLNLTRKKNLYPIHMFSCKERSDIIHRLSQGEFDILVLGGGITGAGIALDAAARGLKVALIEKHDFAFGTSSRSTKLIHGGLRYLKQLQFGLVKEVGRERRTVYQNALHLVRPQKMLLPIVKGGSLGKWSMKVALNLYDRLAGVEHHEKHLILNKQNTFLSEPLLNHSQTLGSGLYYEYRTDDNRLVIEIMKKAVEMGALSLNYVSFKQFLYEQDKISGGEFSTDGDQSITIKARVVINATGPWVDGIRQQDRKEVFTKKLFLSKGVHLTVSRTKLPLRQSVYFDVHQDKRMIFAVPRDNVVYIGTTDTAYPGLPENPAIDSQDVQYLLNAVNHLFPEAKLTTSDVLSGWAGVRPLIYEEGKLPSQMSRKDEVMTSKSGLISIAGGKLTGYRLMAEKVVDKAVEYLSAQESYKRKTKIGPGFSANIKVCGVEYRTEMELQKAREEFVAQAKIMQFPEEEMTKLFYRYGSNTEIVLAHNNSHKLTPDQILNMLYAECWYAIHYEMCTCLTDFLIRRTGLLFFEKERADKYAKELNRWMAQQLDWNPAVAEKSLQDYLKVSADTMAFKLQA